MMKHACRLGSLVLLFLVSTGGAVLAAEIKGATTDAAGGALASARISLENVASGAQAAATTDAEGRYSFGSLAVGIYRVSANLTGFSENSRTVSVASDAEAMEVNFILTVGNLTTMVTVTATRSSEDTMLVPLRAESIGQAQLQASNPTSTGSAMIQAAGITPVADGPFLMRPRLRGLDSTRVLILVDGERLNNARTATDRSGVEVSLVDQPAVQSIEVVSGAGSVLYGTDALSGTINIITSSQPRLSDTTRVLGGIDGYYSTNENGFRGTVNVGVASKKVALRVSGSYDTFDNYNSGGKDGTTLEDTRSLYTGPCALTGSTTPCLDQKDTIDDNFPPFRLNAFPEPFNAPYVRTSTEVVNSGYNGNNFSASAMVAPSEKQSIALKYLRRRADDVGFPDFAPPYFFQGIDLPFSNLDKVSGRYQVRNLTNKYSSLTATLYWQELDRKLQNTAIPVQFPVPSATFFPINVFRLSIDSSTEQDVKTWGIDVQNTFLLTPKNVLTAGFTFYRDNSHDSRVSTTTTYQVGCVSLSSSCSSSAPPTGGPRANVFPSLVQLGPPTTTNPTRVPDSSFRDFGIFAQDEWDIGSKWHIWAGLRFDAYGVENQPTTGYSPVPPATAVPPIDPGTLPDPNGDSASRTAVTGDLGIVFKATRNVNFYGRYGRSYRHANLEELYFNGPATIGNIVPNILVEPETGNNFDTGIKLRTGRVAASLGYFNNTYNDFISTEIVAIVPGSSVSQAINFSKVRIWGIEGDLSLPLSVGRALVTIFGNTAYNKGTILEGTNPLTNVNLAGTPMDNITPFKTIAGLRLGDKKGRFWVEYSLRYEHAVERVPVTTLTSPFLIASDIYSLQGFTIQRVGGGLDWRKKDYSFGLFLALENMTNDFYREQYQFAPARGQSFTVGLHVNKL